MGAAWLCNADSRRRPPITAILRQAPVQHFYDVITNGHGAMYLLADRVQPPDRWAYAAYIRALQRSQMATSLRTH